MKKYKEEAVPSFYDERDVAIEEELETYQLSKEYYKIRKLN